MDNFVKFLAKLPNWISIILTILGSQGASLSVISLFNEKDSNKNALTIKRKLALILTIFLTVIGLFGIFAGEELIEVPNIEGKTYHSAVTTLDRLGITYECVTAPKDPNADVVNFQSETAGAYIWRFTKIVFNIKIANTQGVLVTNNNLDSQYNILEETPSNVGNINATNNGSLKSNIPIASFLENDVSAVLNYTRLTVKVDSTRSTFNNIKQGEIFRWGLHLFSSLENKDTGDIFLELWIGIDDDYTVKTAQILVYTIKTC